MSIASQRADARFALINDLADKFEASGIEYTCGAVVIAFALEHVQDRQDLPLEASRLARRVWDEVHKRWRAKQNRPE